MCCFGKKYSHLSYNDRLQIEALYRAKHSVSEIADFIGVHESTIYRELKRGKYDYIIGKTWEEAKGYSPDIAYNIYKKNSKRKGRKKIIQDDPVFLKFVEHKILDEKFSPYATLTFIKRQHLSFQTKVSLSTLYNYIRTGVFENIEIGDLPYHKKKKKKRKKHVQRKASQGTSIEKRPDEIEERESIGHWEMDTVRGQQGKSKKSLLVLTERKSRIEIIDLLKDGTSKQVIKALNRLERELGEKKFREIFKTITVDNGVEFSDWKGMERSRRNKRNRTKIYYCHPYSSYERGSNENQNKLIRYHIPKGVDFDDFTKSQVKIIEAWINEYPRKLFSGKTSADIFEKEFREKFWRLSG